MRADQRCRRVDDALAVTVGGQLPPGHDRDHLERCLRCQASAVRFRRLGRELGALGDRRYEPPPGLLSDTIELLRSGADPDRERSRSRTAEIAAIAAAATGAAAGALVLGRRLRHLAS